MKITEYDTIFANSFTEVKVQMVDYITMGWQPWGNLIVNIDNGIYVYIQAIVKYARNDVGV